MFHRTTRVLSLTEAGEILLRRASTLVNELQELQAELGRHVQEPRGLLRIAAPLTIGHRYLVPACPRLLARHPHLRVELSLSNRMVDAVGEGIDMVVRIGHMRDSSLVARRLAINERILVASPSYLERRGRPRRLDDLGEHDCLVYRYAAGGSAWRFRKGGDHRRIAVSGSFAANNADALLTICLKGVGIALLPMWMTTEHLKRGELVRLFSSYEVTATDFDSGIFVLYPPVTRMPAKLRAGIDFLVELFEASPWR